MENRILMKSRKRESIIIGRKKKYLEANKNLKRTQ